MTRRVIKIPMRASDENDKQWNQQAQVLWQSGHQSESIECVVAALNAHSVSKPKELLMQFSYYLFLIGDYSATCEVLRNALALYPDDQEIKSNLVVCLSRDKEYMQAITHGEQLVAQDQDNFIVWDALAKSYARTKQWQKATDAGNHSLRIKGQQHTKPTPHWSLPNQSIESFVVKKKRVIAFSLWGTSERYINGAIRNLLLAHDI